MKKLFSIFAGLLLVSSLSVAGNYQLNNENIDGLFEQATETSIMEMATSEILSTMSTNAGLGSITGTKGGDSVIVAAVLCWFFGSFGVHRVYMGSSPKLILIYFITCGGIFGVVTLIDLITLIIRAIKEEGVGSYANNDKFFAWE